MFRIPDGVDPQTRKALQAIQGELFKLAKRGDVRSGDTVYQVVSRREKGKTPSPGLPNETSGDRTIHGDLYVDGTIHGSVSTGIKNIVPAVTDVTGSRVIGTVYQNTNSTMLDVRVSVECA